MWNWLARLTDSMDPADFVLRYRPGRPLRIRGAVPRSRSAALRSFFEADLRPSGPLRVSGKRLPGGTHQLKVKGRLDPAQEQRLRNFLLEILR